MNDKADNLIKAMLESQINNTIYSLLNNYTFSNFNSIFSSEMKIKNPALVFKAREVVNSLVEYIKNKIDEEKVILYELIQIDNSSQVISNIKIIDKWIKKFDLETGKLTKLQEINSLFKKDKIINEDEFSEKIISEMSIKVKSRLLEKLRKENEELAIEIKSIDNKLVK
jgi:hypothetical protein